jgi:rfaE bifunctional protein kinase chain/domain
MLIKNFPNIYPIETRNFLAEFNEKYDFSEIRDNLENLRNLKVLIVGDGIVDEYHYCEPLGKSSKANLIVNRYLENEVFAGGAFAIANHVSGLCDHVQLVTLLGKESSREDFISENLRPNVKTKFFFREDGPTIVKKRYVHQYSNQKLFEINFINDMFVDGDLENQVIDCFESIVPQYDLVLVSDFGHGFITEKIFRAIGRNAKNLAINTQTNAANAGYNLITKYKNPNYVCLDESEIRLAAQKKHSDIEEIAQGIRESLDAHYLVVTLGKRGSVGVNRHGKINRTPIFSTRVLDTIGAGDAFFSFTAPCFARGLSLDLVSFVGNAVGALAVQIVCNKKPVEKGELLEFINTMVK